MTHTSDSNSVFLLIFPTQRDRPPRNLVLSLAASYEISRAPTKLYLRPPCTVNLPFSWSHFPLEAGRWKVRLPRLDRFSPLRSNYYQTIQRWHINCQRYINTNWSLCVQRRYGTCTQVRMYEQIAGYSARCNDLIEFREYNLKVETQDVYQSSIYSSRVEDAMMYRWSCVFS